MYKILIPILHLTIAQSGVNRTLCIRHGMTMAREATESNVKGYCLVHCSRVKWKMCLVVLYEYAAKVHKEMSDVKRFLRFSLVCSDVIHFHSVCIFSFSL